MMTAFAVDRRLGTNQLNTSVAANAPSNCATTNPVTSAGRIPAKVSLIERAMVTAGFANDVDAVNQYADVMYAPTANGTIRERNLEQPHMTHSKPNVATNSLKSEIFLPLHDERVRRQVSRTSSVPPLRQRCRQRIELRCSSQHPASLIRVRLRLLRMHLKTHDGKSELLFVNRVGRPLSANKLREKQLHPLLMKLGIPRGGFHSLRHGAASALLADGVTPAVVQKQLRDSDARITLGIYGHVVGNQQRDAVENRSARIASFAA